MTLYNKYGYCIIPKGTKLYRGSKSTNYNGCMFLGLQKHIAQAFSDKIQIWKVKQDIKVLFMVRELDWSSRSKSAIVDIYTKYHPSSKILDDLEIKHFDHVKRNKLIAILKAENITGWLSSVEDKIDLEICLFPDREQFNQLIKLEKIIEENNVELDYLNALDKIDLQPSRQFFDLTKENLLNSPFDEYKKMIDTWAEEMIKEEEVTEEQARIYWLNLRTKLKM